MSPLHQKLNQLSLTTMSQKLDQILTDAAAKNLSLAAALEALTDRELEARNGRAVERRFRFSRLGSRSSIDSFQFSHHKSRTQLKSRILRLMDLEFLQQGTNIVIIGNTGRR